MILKLIAGIVLSATTLAAAFQYGGIKHDITSQVGTASAIIMNAASTQVQRITGSTAQTIRLPDATTLRAGYWYRIVNENSSTVTVQNSSSFTIGTISGGTRDLPTNVQLYLTSNSTSGGPWTFEKSSSSGGGGSGSVQYVSFGGVSEPSNCTTDPCTLYQNSSGVTAVNLISTGVYEVVFSGGTFSRRPTCTVTNSSNDLRLTVNFTGSSTTFRFTVYNTSAGAVNSSADVICSGS